MRYEDLRFIEFVANGAGNRCGWVISIEEMPGLVDKHKVDCYRSFYRYGSELKEYAEQHGTVKGFEGTAFADYLFMAGLG